MGFSELCSFQYERTIGLLFKVKEKQQQQQKNPVAYTLDLKWIESLNAFQYTTS